MTFVLKAVDDQGARRRNRVVVDLLVPIFVQMGLRSLPSLAPPTSVAGAAADGALGCVRDQKSGGNQHDGDRRRGSSQSRDQRAPPHPSAPDLINGQPIAT